MNLKEKEQKLLEELEKTKAKLKKLKNKRIQEIGKMACKYGLDSLEDKILENKFESLSKEIANGNS